MDFLTRRIINPYSDDENAIRNLTLTVQAVTLIVVVGASFLVADKWALWALAGILLAAIILAWFKIVWPGQLLTPVAIALVSINFMLQGNGIHDISVIGLTGAIVIAGLFLGERGAINMGAAAVITLIAMGVAEVTGYFTPYPVTYTVVPDIVIGAAMISVIGLTLHTTVVRLSAIASQARQSEAAQLEANRELRQFKETLEARVDERTAIIERRAYQLETVSKVAQIIASIQELDQLLPTIAKIVSEQFGYYHTGIFLINEQSDYAVLQAANSEGGQRMLKRGHRLRLGTGIVGYVAVQAEPRIVLNVGSDSVYFNNPDMPDTRSEAALPLKIGSQIIGVLDVQSTETDAFLPDDMNMLGILANQVAVAIENARLFSRTRQALSESQNIYGEYIKRDWARFAKRIETTGFQYDGIKTTSLYSAPTQQDEQTASVPVRIRGLVIGHILLRANDPSRRWTQDELNLVRAAADRAGLAIENVRLLSEAQRRAAKERAIGEITSRIASSIDLESILQTAVEELGHTLPGSEIILQFQEKNQR